MKKLCFVLLMILVQQFFNSYGQKGYKPGYVVTNDFDTLRGFIKLKTNIRNNSACEFLPGVNQTPVYYSPDKIRAYRIDNSKYYVSKNVMIDSIRQRVFLEYLVDGIVDLFYMTNLGKEYYFIEKDTNIIQLSNNGSLVTRVQKGVQGEYEETYFKYSNQYKRMLTYIFQESPEVLAEIPKTAFDYRPLIEITKDYHQSVCKDNKCIDFTKLTKKSLYLEPYAGVINSWMGLKTSKNVAHDIKPYLGLRLRLMPFKGYTNLNLLFSLNYSANTLDGDFDNTLYASDYVRTYRIHTKYSILRFPITIEYTVPTNKIQPFVSMSFNNIFLLNTDYSVRKVNILYPTDERSPLRKYQYGASLGLGLRYKLNGSSYIYLNNELEYRIPFANFNYVLDYQRVYSWLINIGYGFKIK